MVGGVCTIVGLFCISFPVPVIVSHFAFLYNRDKAGREAQALQLLNREFGEINIISENVPRQTIRHHGVSKSFRTDYYENRLDTIIIGLQIIGLQNRLTTKIGYIYYENRLDTSSNLPHNSEITPKLSLKACKLRYKSRRNNLQYRLP